MAESHSDDAQDCYWLGDKYYFGKNVLRDYDKARQEYERAAAQGHEESLRLLQQFAERNIAAAQRCLAALYRRGTGVPRDSDTARQWYEKAAALDDAEARYELGVMYDDGEGVPQDYDKARHWYEDAAALGHALAHYKLGVMYQYARGVQQDYDKARQWYEKAAAQGHEEAQKALNALKG